MNEINSKWNIGNFAVSLTTLVDGEMLLTLAGLGVRYLGQRVSSVDKILGGFEKNAEGKSVRKKDFKRGEVAYSVELAKELNKAFQELELPDSEVKLEANAVISEYTGGTKPVYKEEKEICVRHESKGDLEEWLKTMVKFEGASHDEKGEYRVEMLQAVKGWKIAKLKEM